MRHDEEQKLLSKFMLRRAVPDVLALDIENLKEMLIFADFDLKKFHLHPLTNFVTLLRHHAPHQPAQKVQS